MIHITTLQNYIDKLYDEGATFVPLEEILELFRINNGEV